MTGEPEVEAARNWLDLLRSSIEEIADTEFQARVWMGDCQEPRSSYLEVSTTILDDVPFELIGRHLGELQIDQEQWGRLKEFHSVLREFDNSIGDAYDIGAVVAQQGWKAVVDQARALLAELPQ